MTSPTIVLDTNVLVSAILFGGTPGKILDLATQGVMTLALSESILSELQGVLEGRKFRLSREWSREIVSTLSELGEVVVAKQKISVIKEDPDDNRILECAVAAKADSIVSGDKHLLRLREYEKIVILSPTGFLKALNRA